LTHGFIKYFEEENFSRTERFGSFILERVLHQVLLKVVFNQTPECIPARQHNLAVMPQF
jgi:hypothetical protein